MSQSDFAEPNTHGDVGWKSEYSHGEPYSSVTQPVCDAAKGQVSSSMKQTKG